MRPRTPDLGLLCSGPTLDRWHQRAPVCMVPQAYGMVRAHRHCQRPPHCAVHTRDGARVHRRQHLRKAVLVRLRRKIVVLSVCYSCGLLQYNAATCSCLLMMPHSARRIA